MFFYQVTRDEIVFGVGYGATGRCLSLGWTVVPLLIAFVFLRQRWSERWRLAFVAVSAVWMALLVLYSQMDWGGPKFRNLAWLRGPRQVRNSWTLWFPIGVSLWYLVTTTLRTTTRAYGGLSVRVRRLAAGGLVVSSWACALAGLVGVYLTASGRQEPTFAVRAGLLLVYLASIAWAVVRWDRICRYSLSTTGFVFVLGGLLFAFLESTSARWSGLVFEQFGELGSLKLHFSSQVMTGILLGASPLALACLIERPSVWLRRTRWTGCVGCCQRCGYNRMGLQSDALCPECGTLPAVAV